MNKSFSRRITRQIEIGGVKIGGGAPIVIQSMNNTDTRDAQSTLAQLRALKEAGCEIGRLAVPGQEAAAALPEICQATPLPIVADIHFDYRLALAAIAAGVHGLRINPGNIGGQDRVAQVARAAKAAGVPIRIGVNGGSLDKKLLAKYGGITAEALCESALGKIALLEQEGFTEMKISLKCTDLPVMIDAYRQMAELTDLPLHIGVTEAGTLWRGSLKNAIGIGCLLAEGIGDTLRVSLTADPVEEVKVAKEILSMLGLRPAGWTFVSCPTCGRTEIDLAAMAERVERELSPLPTKRPLKVAVMGCVVNGPGEASDADLGLAGGKGCGMIFCRGKQIGTYPEEELLPVFLRLAKEMAEKD